jgi:hypothetical protein
MLLEVYSDVIYASANQCFLPHRGILSSILYPPWVGPLRRGEEVLMLTCIYRVSQNWRTNYLLPYRGCLNVHEKNMEKMFPTKKSIIFIIIVNGNTM